MAGATAFCPIPIPSKRKSLRILNIPKTQNNPFHQKREVHKANPLFSFLGPSGSAVHFW